MFIVFVCMDVSVCLWQVTSLELLSYWERKKTRIQNEDSQWLYNKIEASCVEAKIVKP